MSGDGGLSWWCEEVEKAGAGGERWWRLQLLARGGVGL